MLSIIVAESENHVIGKDNQLVWHLPADTSYFKKTTLNHTVIMGRKTFDSMGKPLPNRRNLVISRNSKLSIPNVEVFNSLEEALKVCPPNEESFIIGGGELYKEGILIADRIYLTKVNANLVGDSYFPEIPKDQWVIIHEEPRMADDKNPYNFTFLIYQRKV